MIFIIIIIIIMSSLSTRSSSSPHHHQELDPRLPHAVTQGTQAKASTSRRVIRRKPLTKSYLTHLCDRAARSPSMSHRNYTKTATRRTFWRRGQSSWCVVLLTARHHQMPNDKLVEFIAATQNTAVVFLSTSLPSLTVPLPQGCSHSECQQAATCTVGEALSKGKSLLWNLHR